MSARMIGFAATVACIASPSFAADLPEYREGPQTYQRESHTYEREYRRAAPRVTIVPRVVETAPVVEEEVVVVRRPRPRVIIEDYPVYAAPVYAAPIYVRPRAFAYVGPRWRGGPWGGPRPHGGRW